MKIDFRGSVVSRLSSVNLVISELATFVAIVPTAAEETIIDRAARKLILVDSFNFITCTP